MLRLSQLPFSNFSVILNHSFYCTTRLKMSMDWKKCLNNREEINPVEVNPSKLIDSICLGLLLGKLKAYCFSWSALRLVSVFFVDRRQIVAKLSTRRSWYHGRQREVFLQHDSHCACQDVLELGWNQGCLPFDRKIRLGCGKHNGKRFTSLRRNATSVRIWIQKKGKFV